MQFTVRNKCLLLILLSFCLFVSACGQSENEKKKLAFEHQEKAFLLQDKGDLKNALIEQLKVAELRPNEYSSYVNLYNIYVEMENWENALDVAQKAVRLAPEKAEAYYNLAFPLRKLRDKQGAIKAFENSLRLNPKDTNAWINLGVTHEELKDPISAKKAYEEALKVNSEYVPAIYYLAELEVDEGRIDNAIKLFQKAIDVKIPKEREAEELDYQPSAKKRIEELRAKKRKP
jgi:tetratricopeptide (TPR) repeat protein